MLIECPRACICDRCVDIAHDHIDTVAPVGVRPHVCSFCEKREARAQYINGDGVICADCVHLCVEILAEHAKNPGLPRARVVK